MKILSPAGNLESLKVAVYNGADEVYLGINSFNARNNIDGFSIESLKEAVVFAHIFDVKVNLAINILFTDDELKNALQTVVDAYNLGVDSFIIQDLGLAYLVHKYYPQIEIHASTQMALHNLEGIQSLKDFGFKRYVLARETPLSEIKRIDQNIPEEIEYFVQGALCVCFSGNCYLSSYLFDASGNRGKCKQLCRLPYSLQKDGKTLKHGYLLSAKDFCMIDRLDDLKNSGVDVLKIEGRARRPYYVGVATKQYYNALHSKKVSLDDLKLSFNREYTPGYFNGNGEIISKYNNHIGIKIGKVLKVNYGKNFNQIIFSSNYNLSPKSILKLFENDSEYTTLTAYDLKKVDSKTYLTTTTQKIKPNLDVHLIVDSEKESQVLSFTKRKDIAIEFLGKVDEPIQAKVNICGKEIVVYGENLMQAKSQPISLEDLQICFNKNEYFKPIINSSLENTFLTKKQLNEFRRKVYEQILSTIFDCYSHQEKLAEFKIDKNIIKFTDFEYVEDINANFKHKNIIYSPETYSLQDVERFMQKCSEQNKSPYLDLPNFALKPDIELLKTIVNKTKISVIANNYYALGFDANIVIGPALNVYNHITASYFNKPVITSESDISTRVDFPYMTLRHCPFKNHLNAQCSTCPYLKGYTLKMDNGKEFKIKRKKLSTCTFYLTN